jgi:hypothetical protein
MKAVKRPAVVALALAPLLAMLAACGRDPGTPRVRPLPKPDGSPALRGGGAARSPRNASYTIDVTLDPVRHQLTATQTLHWTNTGESPVDTLPFHLYLNAFKNEGSLFMRSTRGRVRNAKASDTNWGWIHVDSVQVGGAELAGKLRRVEVPEEVAGKLPPQKPDDPRDETVVELPLPEPVPAEGKIDVRFKFTAQLPEVFARTGYKGDFHMIAQWFPKIGVRVGPPGAERWECQPFHGLTEFFADFGVYDVAITVPSTYTVAATGVLTSATESAGGTRTFKYQAQDVHDFAWMADPYMEVMSGQAKVEDGTVEVRVVYRPDQKAFARRHLQAGIGAIEKYSAAFLPYPWPIMTIVDPPPEAMFGAGGMEYPTIVTTAADSVFMRPGVRIPEMTTIHEVGHNWFQGMLASNEPVEAWLDEGVNEWANAMVLNELYGPRTSALDWMGWQAEFAALRRAISADPSLVASPIATAAYAFVDDGMYFEQTYGTTMRALRTLEQTVGPTRFAAAMKAYTRAWAFRNPTGRDLFDVLAKELGEDLSWFFAPVFQQVGGLRLAVRTARCDRAHPPRGVLGAGTSRKTVSSNEAPDSGSYVCEVVVTNTGVWHVPVELELKFEDGSSDRSLKWDDRESGSHWERFTIERSSRLTEVILDPDGKIELDSPMTHHYRLDGDGSASLRAGAWFGSMAQTLMQLAGL